MTSYSKLHIPQTSMVYATPPRKVHTPPIEEPAAAAGAAAYLSPPHSAVLSAAFTPPHNHTLFMDTPMAKTTGTNIRSAGAALF
jgi:hypothetical protein